ncbi:hypothetical protein AB9P05_14545 [Roseivirga sp. BDSF3-8]|uniref:hypothetical protein n=1 Tax=Roseivirga sp. BDSF3-8 TaxID=3241598 RepID=UPI003531F6BE
MAISLHILILVILFYGAYRRISVVRSGRGALFCGALVVKLSLTLLSFYIHTEVFKASDLAAYWHDAQSIADLMENKAVSYFTYLIDSQGSGDSPELLLKNQPRALLFAKILSFFYVITAGSAWLTAVWLSACSFAAAWYLFVVINRYFPALTPAIAFSLLFYPSAVFWSSGIQKEALAVPIIFTATALLFPFLLKKKPAAPIIRVAAALMLCIVLWYIKYYYAIVFVPLLFATALIGELSRRREYFSGRVNLQFILWISILISGVLIGRNMHIALSSEHFLSLVARTHHQVAASSVPENVAYMEELKATPLSFIRYAPQAFITGLFRPLPGDGTGSILSWGVALENGLLLIVCLLGFVFFIRQKFRPCSMAVIAGLVYCLSLAVFLAYGMPNFGSLMRYKASFLPFLLLLALAPFYQTYPGGKK